MDGIKKLEPDSAEIRKVQRCKLANPETGMDDIKKLAASPTGGQAQLWDGCPRRAKRAEEFFGFRTSIFASTPYKPCRF